ncbi:MAG: sigma-E processing peptidase SpoIIGA [Bacillota bacterium]|nr:sigma-E processing peptidase SpoIIGA [Bacillota bacterium]MDP4168969.1 sigma-E processing peptidase SpoIIGA [Bacillota bacterium]
MAVYIDVIWALNVLFDSLLLFLTAIILKREIKLWRIVAGGFIGSIIVLLSVTPLSSYSSHPASKVLCSVCMILTTFGYKRWRYFTSGLLTLYFSTFMIGGALIGIHYFIQYDPQLTENVLLESVKGFGDPISWIFVMAGFPLAWHFSRKKLENMEMVKIQFDQLVKVVLTFGDYSCDFSGLVDSGNQLYDPISKMPVMFVSLKARAENMPQEFKKLAEEAESLIMGEGEISEEWQNRMRVIPCKVVGQEHQLVIGVKPDSIVIQTNKQDFVYGKGLVSFTMQQLSADEAFECIVHPKMLTGQKQAVKVS